MPTSNPPPLSDRAIRNLVGERSYDLALDYLTPSALTHCRRAGRNLEARIHGTASKPYIVTVRFNSDGKLDSADCACPVGSSRCKHIAAVLLAYLRDPDSFTPANQLDDQLNRLDKPQLVALLKQAFRRHPNLEVLIDTLPKKGKPLTPKPFKAQADSVFDESEGNWGYTGEIAAQLRAIAQTAEGLDPINTAAVYRGILQSLLDHEYALNDDEPGHLDSIVVECSQALAESLKHLTDPQDREPILHALFNIVHLDIDRGGTGISDQAATTLYDQTTPEDKKQIVPWIREAQSRAKGWAHESLTNMLDEFE